MGFQFQLTVTTHEHVGVSNYQQLDCFFQQLAQANNEVAKASYYCPCMAGIHRDSPHKWTVGFSLSSRANFTTANTRWGYPTIAVTYVHNWFRSLQLRQRWRPVLFCHRRFIDKTSVQPHHIWAYQHQIEIPIDVYTCTSRNKTNKAFGRKCRFDEIVVTGCTESCQNDKYNIGVSVYTCLVVKWKFYG